VCFGRKRAAHVVAQSSPLPNSCSPSAAASPKGITPHKLRHTFASVQFAIGKDPTYVMNQLGHTDPAFTLRVYAHMMRRSPEEREALKAPVECHDWTLGEEQAEESAKQR
jgi:integrase